MKQLIWDLPTRFFHWLLAISVILAFGFAQLTEKESPQFYLHVVFGVLAGILVIWRAIWGFIGSENVRWKNLLVRPSLVIDYVKQVASGHGVYHAGHNPAGAIAALGLLLLVVLTVATGLLSPQAELFEELHESLPFALIGLAVVHVIGVIVATRMNKENYLLGMFSGKKRATETEAIAHAHPLAASVMLVLVLGVWGYFIKGFDLQKALFTAPGSQWSFQVGEPEAESEQDRSSEAGDSENKESGAHQKEEDSKGKGDADGDADRDDDND